MDIHFRPSHVLVVHHSLNRAHPATDITPCRLIAVKVMAQNCRRVERACGIQSTAVDTSCAAPIRPAGDPSHTSWGARSADDGIRRRNHAIQAWNRHSFADLKAERGNNGCY
jgi:hypothetical protein